MAWWFSTGASVATVLSMHPCISSCWWVKPQAANFRGIWLKKYQNFQNAAGQTVRASMFMMMSWHGHVNCLTGNLWGESTRHRQSITWYQPISHKCTYLLLHIPASLAAGPTHILATPLWHALCKWPKKLDLHPYNKDRWGHSFCVSCLVSLKLTWWEEFRQWLATCIMPLSYCDIWHQWSYSTPSHYLNQC